MNIFILDSDLKTNAKYYCDKHVVKMILESAQLLCTVVNLKGGVAPYKTTHINHPCTKWLMEDGSHWDMLVDLVKDLNEEYKYRFNHEHNHKSFDVIMSLNKPKYDTNQFKGMFNSVTDEVRRTNIVDTIRLYREYYKDKFKTIDMKWTRRGCPDWMK